MIRNNTYKLFTLSTLSLAVLVGCNSDDSSAQTTEVSFAPKFNALVARNGFERAADLSDLFSGSMEIKDINGDLVDTQSWSVYLEDETINGPFIATSNKTLSLTPGQYTFNLTLQKGEHTYLGSVVDLIEDGDTDIVPMTIKPVLGVTTKNTNITGRVAEFEFNYPQGELLAVGATHLNVSVNNGVASSYILDAQSGVFSNNSSVWHIMEAGAQNITLELLKDGEVIAHSKDEQESQTIVYGQNISMDLIPLFGEVAFDITENGNDATFNFTVPAEVVNEAGGANNLDVRFQVSGDKNNADQLLSTLTIDGNGDGSISVTLPDFHYDTMDMALTFIDNITNEVIGNCTGVNVALDQNNKAFNCDITLRRRAELGGSLLANYAFNVFDTDGQPVTNASVFIDSELAGITGSNTSLTAGYLNTFMQSGQHVISAESDTLYGELNITVEPLSVKNVDIILDNVKSIVDGVEFRFSANGQVAGMSCVSVNEPLDPSGWADNYMCASENIGMQWSTEGPIANMTCTNIFETVDPDFTLNNFLCLPENSPFEFEWSPANQIANKTNISWNEPLDPNTWADNFLVISLAPVNTTIVIDSFNAGSIDLTTFGLGGSSAFGYYEGLGPINSSRQVQVRDAWSNTQGCCVQMTIDAELGTISSYGGNTANEHRVFYGESIGDLGGIGVKSELNLSLKLTDIIYVDVVNFPLNSNAVFQITLISSNGNRLTWSSFNMPIGMNTISLAEFSGVSEANLADIDGIVLDISAHNVTKENGLIISEVGIQVAQ
ncbi:hypothetical protein [Marinicellulosiphila megalodicopiae]|uniref:hypothetical protein n=1 Tax=Marinicellulosiphila megalodicopiae TaxID=2724896 RepID=UPI003BB121F0